MDYKRLTQRRESPLALSMWAGTSQELRIYNRLAELEDKIENGTLVELPCKVGDEVYQFDNCGGIYEAKIFNIEIHKGKPYYETCGVDFYNTAIGETVFLTKAEAEKKLEELKNGR